jgi:hypothetical protein
MGIEDDDIETSYPAPKSAELPQPGPGSVGPDGIELPANLDGTPSTGEDAGVDAVPFSPHGGGDAGPGDTIQGGLDDGGADHGPTAGPADVGPGETVSEGQQDTGADGQVP